ncbi:MAG: AmmeMemoRadiSam system protein B [Paracoccaceae bacterium]
MLSPAAKADCPPNGQNHAAFYDDDAVFTSAIANAPGGWDVRPTGITVPHHLLAPDLIADGIGRAKGYAYDRIVLLFPDHFRVLDTPFGTISAGFDTILGPVLPDQSVAAFAGDPDVSDTCALADDHGLRALLPFVADALPDVPVLPVAISIRTGQNDWETLAENLGPFISDRTLVLQSTDFSHYLPHHEARLRDQETLNVLAAGDLNALASLRQPDHIDSTGAMYVQMAIQDKVFGAAPVILANRNSQSYSAEPAAETTSYVVAAFTSASGPVPGPLRAERLIIGGDTFFGRAIAKELPDDLARVRLTKSVREATKGLPLVLNLEGVLLPDVPDTLPHLTLGMPAELATDMLAEFGTMTVSLANNHSEDLGQSGLRETQDTLNRAGITSLRSGDRLLRPGLALTALSDFQEGAAAALDDDDLDAVLVSDPTRASVAFMHWGREFKTQPGPREQQLVTKLQERGASIVIGAHPHQASTGLELRGGGETLVLYSLGNFFFDQPAPIASGALAELSVFPQGTVFVRQHKVANLFDVVRGVE